MVRLSCGAWIREVVSLVMCTHVNSIYLMPSLCFFEYVKTPLPMPVKNAIAMHQKRQPHSGIFIARLVWGCESPSYARQAACPTTSCTSDPFRG
jgi:hypothetical protein